MHDKKWIIVTGAAGLIGSGVVRYLNDLGYGNQLVLIDDILHEEKKKNLEGKKYRELISIHSLFHWLKDRHAEISAIIHLGACSDTLEKNESYLYENNTLYTHRLAEYALEHGLRFIYASSAATYGDGSRGFSDDHALLEELQPLNLYGKSKHLFDLWAKEKGVLDKIVGLKYFNVFGPNEAHKNHMASMVFKMIPIVQREGVIRLYKSTDPQKFADGDQCRDFIYVKHAVKMTVDFLFSDRCGIFNIGQGKPTTWNQLAQAVFKALNKPLRIEYMEMPPNLAPQYQNYTCADMSKYGAMNIDHDIELAVDDYVKNHLLLDQRW